MKTCRVCGESKDDSEFRRKEARCRTCYNADQKAWYHAHREHVRQQIKDKRASDPESVRAKERAYWAAHPEQKFKKDARYRAKDPEQWRRNAREWAIANPERVKERNRKNYEANREERIAKQREYVAKQDPELLRAKKRDYYQRNRERILEQARERRKKDPQGVNRGSRMRKVRKRAVGQLLGHHTEQEWRDKLAYFGGCCANCDTSENITRDHIQPLARGGSDIIENIQPLCYSCNARKSARLGL